MGLFALVIIFILISVGLVWYLLAHDRGEREPIGALWLAACFGVVGAIVAANAEALLIPTNNLKVGTPLGTLFVSSLSVGVIEECCKFIPLAIFLYRRRYFNEHTDGIIYFAIAGLGFGLPENILYTMTFGTSAGIGRVILTPFFHAAITGIVGFYLAKAKLAGLKWRAIAPILLAAILVHGIYDFGLASGRALLTLLSIVITLSLSIGFFLFFIRATDLDQEQGLSVVGKNNFCRSCGYPNPHHHLYCARCGQHA